VQSVGLPEGSTLPDDLAESYSQAWEVIKNGQSKTLPATGEDTGSTLIVPIRREQAIIGVVILRSEKPDPFTDEQQDLVERVVARAAVAIENAQLYAAVQAADQAKSEFVGIVAHDLKSPMTSISGYVDLTLLDAEALSDQQQEFLRRIKDTIERMEVLVSDLADISRLESGHFFMEETRVAVSEIVQAVIDSTQPEIEARQHTFVQNVEPDLPDMWVDYYRLLQVLTNLVSNAYKYTPNGGTITFSVGRADDRIQFTVADTGVGLSDENLKNLGSKFWRAEDAFTRSQPGTGLGFAITRSLVEQMGSRMEIASDVGQGSSFGFSVAIAPD
jgi:signal transduction histidine kinase